jgi:hypothetical protein
MLAGPSLNSAAAFHKIQMLATDRELRTYQDEDNMSDVFRISNAVILQTKCSLPNESANVLEKMNLSNFPTLKIKQRDSISLTAELRISAKRGESSRE